MSASRLFRAFKLGRYRPDRHRHWLLLAHDYATGIPQLLTGLAALFPREALQVRLNDLGGTFDEMARAAVAPLLAFITAMVRSTYYGRKRWPSRLLEGILLALVTVAIRPALVYLGMTDDMAVFFGVAMGFIGVDALSEWLKWADKKLSGGS